MVRSEYSMDARRRRLGRWHWGIIAMGTQRDPDFLQTLARRLLASRQLSVLIVDPDVQGAQLLAAGLGRKHMVVVVGTAAAALASIERRVPTLVVTELDLPDASGVTLIARLHSRPATRHVLLMALTRRPSVRDKIAAFEAGADHYLVKPQTPAHFASHVEQLSHFRQVLPLAVP
jgi:PleD family two-component response regulator